MLPEIVRVASFILRGRTKNLLAKATLPYVAGLYISYRVPFLMALVIFVPIQFVIVMV